MADARQVFGGAATDVLLLTNFPPLMLFPPRRQNAKKNKADPGKWARSGTYPLTTTRPAAQWLVVLSLLLSACASAPDAAPVGPKPYFNLSGFLDTQRAYLESVVPAVTKTVSTNGQPAETQRQTHLNWTQELTFFYEADLNKPALHGAYDSATVALADGAQRRTYTRRPDERTPIRQLTVETTPSGAVRRIQAEQDERNFLFRAGRTITLTCDARPDHNRLTAYTVSGFQKLIFFDQTTYAVRGEIE